MDGTWTIREAAPADAAEFARIQIDAWRAAYGGILPADYLARLDSERLTAVWEHRLGGMGIDDRQLAVCVSGRIVGWSGFGAPRDDVDDGVGELHAINLDPAYWSVGIGSFLFSRSVCELAGMGYGSAYLWVADGNARALAFYGRHGWTLDGSSKDDDRFVPPLRELRVVSPPFG
ncbi:N-acetyltransferase [Arthrobacter pityocampae]|uniref:N-acetyltransferase n=1 Tax=Arthrobacter pityocampae TaxID=547334 RepID=A0A2S5IWU9_9MICC|nr:GNAT family N-acetyltransferase [Arthrobacter pityocampae]PPB49049.1 N-acetyltransferase [Arthrobacter pityocampae]